VRVVLRHCTETSAADWLVHSGTPPGQLITFGPAGYEAYARLRFIPDPSWPGQLEAEAEVPDDHPSDIAQARLAFRHLAGFTTSPDQCYFCAWDGYSGSFFPAALLQGALVSIPPPWDRRYALFTGPLIDIESWEDEFGKGSPPPAFVWPVDHGWCFASDVDSHWAGIGGEQVAIDRLIDDPKLDVVRAQQNVTPPAYR
jgi:hypothetical protein